MIPKGCECDWEDMTNLDRSIVVAEITYRDPACQIHGRDSWMRAFDTKENTR